MGLFAYDTELQKIVEAQYAVKKPKGHYLCPNRNCKDMKVPVFVVKTDYGKHYSSYDASMHDENCDFTTSYQPKYQNKSLVGFDSKDLYLKLLQKPDLTKTKHKTSTHATNSTINDLSPTTLRKLYYTCMSNDLNFHLNDDYTVDDICVSLRNACDWEERIWDEKILLVVGTIFHIDWKARLIILKISENLKINFDFEEQEHYNHFYSNLKKFSDTKNIKVAVYGIFYNDTFSFLKGSKTVTYKRNTTEIYSLSQIMILSRCKK